MIRDLSGIVGLIIVAIGVGLIYHPAGVIALGVELVLLALFGFTDDKKKTGN
jgi:hypothetical protein